MELVISTLNFEGTGRKDAEGEKRSCRQTNSMKSARPI